LHQTALIVESLCGVRSANKQAVATNDATSLMVPKHCVVGTKA